MTALLRKDIYTLCKQMRWALFFMLIWALWPKNAFMNSFAIIYMSMIPYSAMASDERCRWDQLVRMMPYSVCDIVLSKYILGWGMAALAAALSGVFQMIFSMIQPEMWRFIPELLLNNISLTTLALALSLPPMFYFGVERGRMVRTFTLAVLFGGVGVSAVISDGLTESLSVPPGLPPANLLLTVALLILALVLTGISVPLSTYLYKSRLKNGS